MIGWVVLELAFALYFLLAYRIAREADCLRCELQAERELRIQAERLAATYASDADTYRRVIRERHGRAK